ncbi:MAG: hypothetical protein AAF564_15775 [Bacteroidota bacterium]
MKFRSYRVLIRSVVLLITMASLLPFVQHACAMMSGDMKMHRKCCCMKQAADSHGDAHHHSAHQNIQMAHHGSHEMHDMPDEDIGHQHMPADERAPVQERVPCEHPDTDPPAPGDCCTVESESSVADDYLKSRLSDKSAISFSLRARLLPAIAEIPIPFTHQAPDPPHESLPARHVILSSFLI